MNLKKIAKPISGLLVVAILAVAVFFAVQYAGLSSDNSSLEKENTTLKTETAAVSHEITDLKQKIERYDNLVSKLNGENVGLREERKKMEAEIAILRLKTDTLEQELKILTSPPQNQDASTPWERLESAMSLIKQGDFGGYWEFLDSEFKATCSRDKFVDLLKFMVGRGQLILTDFTITFIDQGMGDHRATVWFMLDDQLAEPQDFILEDGQWFIYIGPASC